jgi:hypothetical protein
VTVPLPALIVLHPKVPVAAVKIRAFVAPWQSGKAAIVGSTGMRVKVPSVYSNANQLSGIICVDAPFTKPLAGVYVTKPEFIFISANAILFRSAGPVTAVADAFENVSKLTFAALVSVTLVVVFALTGMPCVQLTIFGVESAHRTCPVVRLVIVAIRGLEPPPTVPIPWMVVALIHCAI